MTRPRLPFAPTWPTLLLALVLAGCASRQPSRDGAEARPPPNLDQVPNAVPRVEPLRSGGPNKPYEVLGQRYVPMTGDAPLSESGLASWYGRKFHGRPTASGETYDMYAMTAAHKTMPLPSYARVRNPANGRQIIVRVNDRGPFAAGRVIDLSYTAALKLGVLAGVAPVQVQRLTWDDIRNGAAAQAAPPADDPAPGDGSVAATAATAVAAVAADTAGFWLQLGAFRAREGAAQLQQRVLRHDHGLPGLAVFDEDGLFRLQAGPYGARDQALQAAQRLQRQTGLDALVVERHP